MRSLAHLVGTQRTLGLAAAVLVTQPLPPGQAMDANEIGGIIEQAITEADDAGVKGKDVTPFLLGKINELTGGRSLTANIALIQANAKLAAELANELTG